MTETQKQPDSSTRTRLRSAMIFGPVVLLGLGIGGGIFTLMMAATAAIAVFEWVRMVTKGQEGVPAHIDKLASALSVFGVLVGAMMGPIVSLWFLLALCFLVFAYNFSQTGPNLRLVYFGFIYIVLSINMMIWLRDGTSWQGLYNFVTFLFIVWGSDVCAYFSGRAIGGPKLAPKISPKKTWAGFIGSSLGAGMIAAGLTCPWFLNLLDLQTIGGMGYIGYFVMGFILAMFGQAGDLLISLFKRHFDVKDTGTLIPGHGGILDRIDALLLVAYIFAMAVRVLS